MDRELTVAETGAERDGGEGEGRRLTAAQFQGLADIPPEIEWAANIRNRNTRRAYQRDRSRVLPLRRHPRRRRTAPGHPGPCHRLAPHTGSARAGRRHRAPQALGAGRAL